MKLRHAAVLLVLGLSLCLSTAYARDNRKVEVVIEGLQAELLQNVEALLTIRGQPPEDLPLDNWVRRHHARATKQIQQALQPYGYYAPQIDSALTMQEGGWRVRYRIDAGKPVLLRQLDVRVSGEGQLSPLFSAALDKMPLKSGQTLRHSQYEETKALLQQVALRYGYLDARFSTSELRVNAPALWADVVLHYDTGPRYRLGQVSIEQDILEPAFIQRYVPFAPGEPYDRLQLVELENGLIDSNYFSDVEVELLKEQAEDHVLPIGVTTTPRKPQLYSAGLGYGTDTGPRLNLGFDWRRVNAKGHRAGANLTLSGVRESLSAQYQIPIADVRKDTLSFGANVLSEDAGDGINEERELGITHTTSWRGWRRSLYLTLGQNISTFEADRQRFDLVIPGITLTRTRSDNPIYPRNSIGLSLDVHGAHQNWFSDATFLQGRLLTRYIRPLLDDKTRLILRGELGVTGLDEATELPLSQRFFAGGDQSVRGYKYQSLGDTNELGEVIGGQYLLVGSIEVDRLVWNDWGVAAFIDAGNASNDSRAELLKGAGLGLRWRSPVGLIRLDLATPLDEPPDGDRSNYRIHFGIGVEL
ncbi:autotransporter assembly complex family protein [Pseudomonas sp.]|uniref:autotransporter assembly complex protein TamA n=1 Tax=Pseudomonas sp. TaxID=306 RepID=UPI00356499A6